MKVNGHVIKDRMDVLKEQAAALDAQFTPSLYKFEGEHKEDPRQIMRRYEELERKIAGLQEVQGRFNLRVKVEFEDKMITLASAIKLFGVLGRVKNQWKGVSKPDPYAARYGTSRSRSKDEEHPVQVVSDTEAAALAAEAGTKVMALKQAIRQANATPVELDVDEALFAD